MSNEINNPNQFFESLVGEMNTHTDQQQADENIQKALDIVKQQSEPLQPFKTFCIDSNDGASGVMPSETDSESSGYGAFKFDGNNGNNSYNEGQKVAQVSMNIAMAFKRPLKFEKKKSINKDVMATKSQIMVAPSTNKPLNLQAKNLKSQSGVVINENKSGVLEAILPSVDNESDCSSVYFNQITKNYSGEQVKKNRNDNQIALGDKNLQSKDYFGKQLCVFNKDDLKSKPEPVLKESNNSSDEGIIKQTAPKSKEIIGKNEEEKKQEGQMVYEGAQSYTSDEDNEESIEVFRNID